MKALYNKYKREVWIGVVVSLITTAVLKFGDWLVDIVPAVGSSVFETISNIVYSLAATYSDNVILNILLLGSFSFLVGTLAKFIAKGLHLFKSSLRLERNSRKFSSVELEEINEQASIELENERNKNTQNTIPELIQHGKRIGKSAVLTLVLIVFTYIFITFSVITPMSLSNKFEQDIAKIAPYVEESETIQLKSDWVCMRSKADHDVIYERINQVKEEHDLP